VKMWPPVCNQRIKNGRFRTARNGCVNAAPCVVKLTVISRNHSYSWDGRTITWSVSEWRFPTNHSEACFARLQGVFRPNIPENAKAESFPLQ